MYYYKARMYDAKLGRFLQTDPIGYQDGMNWYGYTSGDPVNRRDPTGLSSTTCSNDPGVCQPPIEEVHVYGSMSGSSWSCEGWVCQDFLRDIFRTQDAQEGSLRETEAQRKLRLSGDVEGYYKARTAAGDAYAARALMVVQNQCTSFDVCLMASANFGLHGTAFINRVYVDTRDVQLRLMNAHALAVEADNLGVPGLLNPTQITVYHHQVFTGLGLPKVTFGGTPLTGQLWEVGIWGGLWCKGCDTQ